MLQHNVMLSDILRESMHVTEQDKRKRTDTADTRPCVNRYMTH